MSPRARGAKAAGGSLLVVPSWQLSGRGGMLLGGAHLDLLREILRCGSLRQAAQRCGVSYRTAWNRVGELNACAGESLVLSVNGGANGGESVLTEKGRKLVETHERARVLFQAALDRGGIDPVQADSWVRFLRRISMRTSARNQLWGRIATVRDGAVNTELDLVLPGGDTLVAQVSLASRRALALEPGTEIWALVKASWVEVARGPRPVVSARNVLRGVVVGIHRGAVAMEVELSLRGGDRIVAITGMESFERLGLQRGSRAWAVFDASSVILGTLG